MGKHWLAGSTSGHVNSATKADLMVDYECDAGKSATPREETSGGLSPGHSFKNPPSLVHTLFICQTLYWTLPMLRILPILALALHYGAFAQTPPLSLTLQDAMERAKANSQQLLSADIAARIA